MRLDTRELAAVLAAATCGLATAQTPLNSAFLYQGQLRETGIPAAGTYDMQFRLFDAATLGGQVGATICQDDVTPVGGLFSVALDFGSTLFDGNARWLEVGVRADATAGNCTVGPYTVMATRQPITAAPYALYALNGGHWSANGSAIYNSNAGNVGIGDSNPLAFLHVGPEHLALGPADLHSEDVIIAGGDGVLGIYSDAAGGAGNGSAIALGEIGAGLTDKWGIFRDTNAAGADLHISYGVDPDFAANSKMMTFDAATGGVGIGTSSPGARLHVAGGRGMFDDGINVGTSIASPYKVLAINDTDHAIYGKVEADSGAFGYGVYGQSDSSSGGGGVFGIAPVYGVRGHAFGATGTARGGEFTSDSTGGEGIFGYASASTGTNYGVRGRTDSPNGFAGYFEGRGYFSGLVGLGTNAPSYRLQVQENTPVNEAMYVRNSGAGRAATFESLTAGGVSAVVCYKHSGAALQVLSDLSAAGTIAGDVPLAVGGGSDTSAAGGGFLVLGSTTGTNVSFDNNEILARNNGVAATLALNAEGGNVNILQSGTGNVGIGTASPSLAKLEIDVANQRCVYGTNNSTTLASAYFQNLGSGPAGVFDGSVTVIGSLSKSSGSFRIDHPLDPANKYLYHSFVESPDMKNLYDGVVVTDERGYATIAMPSWFEALNRDFRYQLTVIDAGDSAEFALAKVVQEITDRQFKIRTSRGGVKVSWQVTGTRQDAWAEAHRIPVEQDKPGHERGKYQHPELYGLPAEMGLGPLPSTVSYEASADAAQP
ncbi:MAG: hypothetical protein U1D55_01810 [Phycisphaerae bacterium]